MGLNMTGVGFNVGADTSDFDKGVKNVESGFSRMASGMKATADSFASVGTTGVNLTTTYENLVQQTGVSTREQLGRAGVLGKELDALNAKATGLAIGMDVSADAAAHGVMAFNKYRDVLKAAGIDSEATAIKFEKSLGVSINTVGQELTLAAKGMNLSKKDISDLAKSAIDTGSAIRDMSGYVSHFGDRAKLARERSLLLAAGFSTIGGKEAMESIDRATARLYALTGDVKGSQEGALILEKTLSGALKNIQGLFAGAESELSSYGMEASIITGNVTKAFEMAKQGPDEFIMAFGKILANLKKEGKPIDALLSFVGARLRKTLGDDQASVIMAAFKNVDEAKLKAMAATKSMGKDLGKVANEVFRSTMTERKAMDLITGAGEAQFRQLGSSSKTFLADLRSGWNSFNSAASALVGEGGPLGKFTAQLADAHRLGAMAFLPKTMRPMASIFGTLYKQIEPNITAFGAFTKKLFTFEGAATAALTGIMGIHAAFAKARKDSKGKKSTEEIGADIGKSITQGIKDFFGIGGATQGLGDTIKLIFEELSAVIKNIDWAGLWTSLTTAFSELWTQLKALWAQAKPVIHDLWEKFKKWWDDTGGPAVMEMWEKTIKPKLEEWWGDLKKWWESDVKPKLIWLLEKGVKEAFNAIFGESAWEKYAAPAIKFAGDVMSGLGSLVSWLTDIFKPQFTAVWESIKAPIDAVSKAIDWVKSAAQPLLDTLNSMAGPIMNLVQGVTAVQQAKAALAGASDTGKEGGGLRATVDTKRDIQTQLLEQTMAPKWYTDSYQPLFMRGVAQIVQAVQNIKQAPPGPAGQPPAARPRPNPATAPLGGFVGPTRPRE